MVSPTATVGIAAQSFGFGPASKAAAVARELHGLGISTVALAGGLAREYFLREGLECADVVQGEPSSLDEHLSELDAVVVALDDELAGVLHESIPVVFIDSLGFMWPPQFYEESPWLKNLASYCVQDLFGAAEKVESRGVAGVCRTAAIVQPPLPSPDTRRGVLAHLGGVVNIFGSATGLQYARSVSSRILSPLAAEFEIPDVALSATAIRLGGVPEALHPVSLPNNEVRRRIAESDAVLTSPGLTTILECSSAGTRVVPLPPQNWSQVLIINHVSNEPASSPLWDFLVDAYPSPADVDESEGVRLVGETNAVILEDSEFVGSYLEIALQELSEPGTGALQLGAPFDGARTCALEVARVAKR